MNKRRNLPVWSFGGEEPDPDVSTLAAWAGRQKGGVCDLLSFKVECSLKDQKELVRPAYGGMYYAERMYDSIGGIRSGFLREEPWARISVMMLRAQFHSPERSGLSFRLLCL